MNFFKYWKTCPELSGGGVGKLDSLREELATKPIFSEDDWEIRPHAGGYYDDEKGIAVMGNVPYPINWQIVRSKLSNSTMSERDEVLFAFIRSNKTILRFDTGD